MEFLCGIQSLMNTTRVRKLKFFYPTLIENNYKSIDNVYCAGIANKLKNQWSE